MNIKLQIILLLVSQSYLGSCDTSTIIQGKNIVAIGIPAYKFHTIQGFQFADLINPSRGVIYKLRYNYLHNVKNKIFVGIYYTGFDYRIPVTRDMMKGTVDTRIMNIFGISVHKEFNINIRNRSLTILTGPQLLYRNGFESIFLSYYPGGFDYVTDRTQYNSIGCGAEIKFYKKIRTKFLLSMSFNSSYFFQKNGLSIEDPNSKFYEEYRVNRLLFTFYPSVAYNF